MWVFRFVILSLFLLKTREKIEFYLQLGRKCERRILKERRSVKKRYAIVTSLLLFGAGGCSVNDHNAPKENNVQSNEAEQPKSAAVKDENTKKQLTSMKETKPGYYTFQSKTKDYQMLISTNATVNQDAYEKRENAYENLELVDARKNENKVYLRRFVYQNKPLTQYMDALLETLSATVGYKGSYEKQQKGNITYYIGKDVQPLNNQTGYAFLGYAKDNKSDKAVEFTYIISSKTTDKLDQVNLKEEKNKFLLELKSVQFIGDKNKGK